MFAFIFKPDLLTYNLNFSGFCKTKFILIVSYTVNFQLISQKWAYGFCDQITPRGHLQVTSKF